MRFSYIDSQGKEIEVDSVESLALRIELGAIEPDTRMYDAVADRWAPAQEHPVFRSLSRGEELTEEDVVPIGTEEDEDGEPAGERPEADVEPSESDAEPSEPDEEGGATARDEDDPLGLDFKVSMAVEEEADGEEPGGEEPGGEESEEPGHDVFGLEGFGADTVELEESPEAFEPDEPDGPDDLVPPEEGAEPGPGATGEPADDGGPGAGPVDEPDAGGPPPWAAEGSDVFAEEEPDEEPDGEPPTGPGADPGASDPGELPGESDGELPAWAREAPAWDEEEPETASPEPPAGPEAAPGSGTPSGTRTEEPEGAREPGEGPVRPAHWDARKKALDRREKLRKVAAAVVLVAALGVAGAYVAGVGGLPGVSPDEEAAEEEPLIPELPDPLRSALDVAGDEAWAAAVEEARPDDAVAGLPAEPPDAWLEGIYLSTAGDYPGVATYWNGVGDAVDPVRERAEEAFRAELSQRLDRTSGIEGQRQRLLEVGMQELELSTPRREAAVREVLAVVDAALSLHELLVARQDDIAYEPYSSPGVSRDPVLEAVPETEGLREEMNTRLDRVLAAVADSGIPRPITTDGTVDRLMEVLRSAGWRYRPEASGR